MKQQTTLRVRTDLKAGAWSCLNVRGQADRKGNIWGARSEACYKPQYAPLFGAPVFDDGGADAGAN